MSSMITRANNWGLVVRTRNRSDVLARCIRAALAQSFPPTEIIVIDASDDLAECRNAITHLCGSALRRARFVHEPAAIRSITHQLDQGIRLASADVVFSIDDDSIMYPTAAEAVMKVYQSATNPSEVAAVGLAGSPTPPDEVDPAALGSISRARPWKSRLRNRLDGLHRRFIPYEGWRTVALPDGISSDTAIPQQSLMGWQTTSRREYALAEPPCRFLFAGKLEDVDFTYRLGRHGAVLLAKDAKVCHLMSATGRRSRRTHGVLQVLSMAILTRCYNPRRNVPISFLARRLLSDLAADVLSRRITFPQFRGAFRGSQLALRLRTVPDAVLDEWCQFHCRRELEVLQHGKSADPKRFA